jgi:hypothetical protein
MLFKELRKRLKRLLKIKINV